MRREVLVLAALAAAGCNGQATDPIETEGAATVAIGDTVRMRVGDVVRIGDSDVYIAFRRVEQDSRCPTDVDCVWAGDAHVRLEAGLGRRPSRPVDLHTTLEPKAAVVDGFTLRLLDVTPAPVSTREIPQRDYVIRLEIAGG